MALLPTGGGKSICYQVPALLSEGLTIVVSPLIALMKDQVLNLKKRGIPAAMISGALSYREIDILLDNAVFGKYKLLYVSPERLKTEVFIERMKKANLSFIAVDEAHCVSQWGYDFRPNYLKIAEFRTLFPKIPLLALTATATPDVVTDIQEKLHFSKGQVIQASFYRSNLHYIAIEEENKHTRILTILTQTKSTALVYCNTRKRTRELANFLYQNGISADFYHGGLNHEDRSSKQQKWIENQTRVICCTNAFGMGIDKPDVKLVMHLDVPNTLEGYFQEAGRAGRNGNEAHSILLYHESDFIELKESIHRSFPEKEDIIRVYRALGNFFQLAIGSGKNQSFPLDLIAFKKRYNLSPLLIFNSIKILERQGLLTWQETTYLPSRIKFLVQSEELYRFKVANKSLTPLIDTILRSYQGCFEEFVTIQETLLAQRLKMTRFQVIQAFRYLSKLNIIEYIEQSEHPRLYFTEERIDERNLSLTYEAYHGLKQKQQKQAQHIIQFLLNKQTCRSILLLQYFGETSTLKCGHCDNCLKSRKEERLQTIKIREAIHNNQLTEIEIINQFPITKKKAFITLYRKLKDEGKIEHSDDGFLSWRG